MERSSIWRARLRTSLPRFVIVYLRSALLRATSNCLNNFLKWYANLPDSFFDLKPARALSSEYVSGPFVLRIRSMSILFGLAITEKIILTRLEADSKTPPFLESFN